MKAICRFTVLLVCLAMAQPIFAQKSLEKKLRSLDEYLAQARDDWNVPGLAVGIVKDGKLVFAKGYGERNVDTGEPVDENTLFAIASNTKAFTSAALAMLVDEGKIGWDDRVRDHLPWFDLYDPYVTEHFTIADLLSHRSGLATFSGDLVWYGTTYSREEVVRRARFLEPVHGFREHFGYSNIMYIAAGLIVEKVSGMTWDEFIQERILDPLGMGRTLTTIRDLDGMENVSAPHNDWDEGLITIDWQNWDNMAPAGSLISSVEDVSRWLIFQMNRGILENGDTLIDPARFREMWTPHISMQISSFSERMFPSTHFSAYGLGWGLMDYQGRKVMGHSGGYDGFITFTGFIPEEDLGFIILTNKNSSLYYPLRYKILDVMMDKESTADYSKEILSLIERREQQEEQNKLDAEAKRVKDTQPTLAIDAYLGTYTSELYGDAEVYQDGDQMMLRFLPTPMATGHLSHWQYNTWQIELREITSLGKGLVNFIIDQEGEVSEMKVNIPNPDFDFTELKFLRR